MARRKPYTEFKKTNQIRPEHVEGMGDIVFKGFQCLNSNCQEFIFIRKDELGDEFQIICPSCGFCLKSEGETKFFDYQLVHLGKKAILNEGQFTVLHEDYIDEAQEYKYCLLCNTMKPLIFFGGHRSRSSGKQGECKICKTLYNRIKNPTRITDQHREAAQKRRMYVEFTGTGKIDSKVIFERFNYQCFKCGIDLREVQRSERALDHTLPAYYLWPLTTENATLLCKDHNGEKAEKWPSAYYTESELKKLSVLTGIPYETLADKPFYNPIALNLLKKSEHVDALLTKYAAYMDEIIKLRNRIFIDTGVDFFTYSETISEAWVKKADATYERIIRLKQRANREQDIDEK